MLYDPKWEKTETKVAHPSLAGLIAWLETRPPEGEYNFDDCDGACLVSLYGASFKPDWNHSRDYMDACEVIFGNAMLVGPACETPWTFGAALARARAALAKT